MKIKHIATTKLCVLGESFDSFAPAHLALQAELRLLLLTSNFAPAASVEAEFNLPKNTTP